jgi:hypothetical protein
MVKNVRYEVQANEICFQRYLLTSPIHPKKRKVSLNATLYTTEPKAVEKVVEKNTLK